LCFEEVSEAKVSSTRGSGRHSGHAGGIFLQVFVEPHPEPLSPKHLVVTFQLPVVEPPAAVVEYVVPAVTDAERLLAERLREVGERLNADTDGV
jgi:hypothetical protein